MMIDMDWWTRLARTNPESAAWLYLRELFESDHTHGFDDFVEDDGFMRLRAPGYSEIQVTSDGERMWPQWEAYLFTPDGYRRTVDGPKMRGWRRTGRPNCSSATSRRPSNRGRINDIQRWTPDAEAGGHRHRLL